MSKSRSPKLLIFLTIFIDLLGFGIIIPILGYIGDEYAPGTEGMRYFKLAALMASYSLLQMIFAPIWGRLSDRIGRRPIIMLGLAGSVMSYAIFGLARSYWVLLLGRSLAGICGANLTAAQAYIADITEEKDRSSAMGLIGMAFGLGFAFGPVLGGLAAWAGTELFPDHAAIQQTAPGLLAATICLLNLIAASRLLPESLPPEKRATVEPGRAKRLANFGTVVKYLGHPVIGPMVLVFFLLTAAFANMESVMSIYAKRIPELDYEPREVYNLFIYVGLLLAFMHGYVNKKLVKIVPEMTLVVIGAAAQVLALALFPLVPATWCMLVSLTLLAFGQGVCVPSLLATVSKATDSKTQGEVMGVTQSASSLARIIGPIIAMAVLAAGEARRGEYGAAWPFWAGALIMMGGVGMAMVTRKRLLAQPLPEHMGEG